MDPARSRACTRASTRARRSRRSCARTRLPTSASSLSSTPVEERRAEVARGAARDLYVQAARLAPEAEELAFWAGLGVAADDLDAGVQLVRRAVAQNPSLLTLLERLPAELEPTAEPLRAALRE